MRRTASGLSLHVHLCVILVCAVIAGGLYAQSDLIVHDVESCRLCQARERIHSVLPWLDAGADFRLRTRYANADKLDAQAHGHDIMRQSYRARLWGQIRFSDDVTGNLRIVTEPVYYWRPDLSDQFGKDEALFDQMNVTWKNAFGLPMTAVIGRQDISLGSGWLVRRGTPLDGSRTNFYDALRLTWDIDRTTTADLVYIENHANSSAFIRPFNDQNIDLEEQDARGSILYISHKPEKNRQIDAYFISKHDHHPTSAKGRQGDTYTFGSLLKGQLDNDWGYQVEFAPQFGNRNGKDIFAFAANNYLTYHMHDKANTRLRFGYEYVSGDDDPDKFYDRPWGRKTQFSELYDGPISTIDGRKKDGANLHRVSLAHICDPAANMELFTSYNLLFADQNTSEAGTNGLSRSGVFKGQLLRSQLMMVVNQHVAHRLEAELFLPGNYYDDDRNDPAVYLRYQIMFTW